MFFTLFLIFVFILGTFIPVPGFDAVQLNSVVNSGNNGFLQLLNGISGGALSKGTLFALGITPYINASIIIQLLAVGIPALERLQKEGDEGRKKIEQYTRILGLVLAIVQAVGICLGYRSQGIVNEKIFDGKAVWLVYVIICLILSSGAMIAMWLGERITEKGVSNGISLLIFTGILATAGTQILKSIQSAANGTDTTAAWSVIGFFITVIIVFTLIVFIDLAERRVAVQYAKQIKGRKMYGGQNTHIPIKISAGGVMPLIFAFALLQFPQMIGTLVAPTGGFVTWWNANLGANSTGWGRVVYSVVLSLLILFFAFFYGQIQFNPEDVSRNIQQYGGFIPGIRPGKPTTDYLKKINNRITFFGAIFLAFIALVPTLLFGVIAPGSPLMTAFSTTGLLIVVSVALEFNKQLEGQLMMKHYKGFLD